MRRFRDVLIELGYGLAFLWTLAVGVALIGTRFDFVLVRLETEPPYLRDVIVGAGLIVIALYFLLMEIRAERRARASLQAQGPEGPIWVSLVAVRGFIRRLLEEELGLSDARVLLRTRGEELVVQVRTSLPLDVNVTELGERIQEHIKSRVESRIGVSVERVEIFAQNISVGKETPPASAPASEEYTPIELSERDQE